MGTSFAGFREHGFWAPDGSLEVWFFLLAREVRKLEAPEHWLIAAAQDWHDKATSGVIGWISENLDAQICTPDRITAIVELSERVLAWLKSQGEVLPVALLNSFGLGGPGACFTKDVPTQLFLRVGETFIRLLKGELDWDAGTSPVVM